MREEDGVEANRDWGTTATATKTTKKLNLDLLFLSLSITSKNKNKNSHRHDGLRRRWRRRHLQVGRGDVLEREPAGGRSLAAGKQKQKGGRKGRRLLKDADDGRELFSSFRAAFSSSIELISIPHIEEEEEKLFVKKRQFAFVC